MDKLLNEETMKIVKNEYATKYLENLGIYPTAKNIKFLLDNKPFSKCRLEAGANIEGKPGQIDTIKIYPST